METIVKEIQQKLEYTPISDFLANLEQIGKKGTYSTAYRYNQEWVIIASTLTDPYKEWLVQHQGMIGVPETMHIVHPPYPLYLMRYYRHIQKWEEIQSPLSSLLQEAKTTLHEACLNNKTKSMDVLLVDTIIDYLSLWQHLPIIDSLLCSIDDLQKEYTVRPDFKLRNFGLDGNNLILFDALFVF